MSPTTSFVIDLSEEFPTLAVAPSVEAVIYWQARANSMPDVEDLKEEMARRLPEYPTVDPQKNIEIPTAIEADASSVIAQKSRQNGLRLKDDLHHVIQFTPTGVALSRLNPYEQWDSFLQESLRAWDAFVEIAQPRSLQQLGVRYINQIQLEFGEMPETYVKIAPQTSIVPGLTRNSFFYQDSYKVPNSTYYVDLVRTLQSQSSTEQTKRALIIDINVFSTPNITMEREILVQRLNDIRWIKNKIFFSCLTETAIERFRGETNVD